MYGSVPPRTPIRPANEGDRMIRSIAIDCKKCNHRFTVNIDLDSGNIVGIDAGETK